MGVHLCVYKCLIEIDKSLLDPFINMFRCYHYSCLLLRYASQNSLDESSQKQTPRPSKDKCGSYHNNMHTNRSFDMMNEMRK